MQVTKSVHAVYADKVQTEMTTCMWLVHLECGNETGTHTAEVPINR